LGVVSIRVVVAQHALVGLLLEFFIDVLIKSTPCREILSVRLVAHADRVITQFVGDFNLECSNFLGFCLSSAIG